MRKLRFLKSKGKDLTFNPPFLDWYKSEEYYSCPLCGTYYQDGLTCRIYFEANIQEEDSHLRYSKVWHALDHFRKEHEFEYEILKTMHPELLDHPFNLDVYAFRRWYRSILPRQSWGTVSAVTKGALKE